MSEQKYFRQLPATKEMIETVKELNTASATLRDEHKYKTAIALTKRALKLAPHDTVLWSNLGAYYWNDLQFEKGLQAIQNSLVLDPNHADAKANLGLMLNTMGKFDEGEKFLREIVEKYPEMMHSKMDLAFLCLNTGKWEEGLRLYENRLDWQGGQNKYYKFPVPFWQGEDLTDKTIYVQVEQGIGDTILFSRYLYWLYEKYPNVQIKLCCSVPFFNLFWEFKQVMGDQFEFLPEGVPYPHCDYGVYMGSLPYYHGTTPDNIYPDPGLIKKRVVENGARFDLPAPVLPSRKIGVCWTGNPIQIANEVRSFPLEKLLEIGTDPYTILYSFQVGIGSEELKKTGAEALICDLSGDFVKKGLVETGLAMMEMDLIITCCTSVSHLAGALGVPCWTILCCDSYWVWLRGRRDSVWYPNHRLYRQKEARQWDDVFEEVYEDLKHFQPIPKDQ